MNNEVQVSVKGVTVDSGVVEVCCRGKYAVINEVEYIKYDEVLEEAAAQISNIIKLRKGSVEMIKKGPLSSKMLFIPGKNTECVYETPFGEIPMEIHTKNVDIIRTEERLRILLEYQLGMGPEQAVDCSVDINIANVD